MLVRPSRKRAARVPMSRFNGLVTMADVPSRLLGVMVPVGRRKCSDTLCHELRRIAILATAIARLLQSWPSSVGFEARTGLVE